MEMSNPNGFDLALMALGYLTCAIWTMADEDNPDDLVIADFAPESRRIAEQDCADFVAANAADVTEAVSRVNYAWDSLGHDLWLTRNGHGAGFWDREQLDEGEVGARLTVACLHKECDCIVGDDGKLHLEGGDRPFNKGTPSAVTG